MGPLIPPVLVTSALYFKTCVRVTCVQYLAPPNEVWGKVIFLHLSVILFTGGGLRNCMLGYTTTPLGADTLPTPQQQTTGTRGRHPPGVDNPPGTRGRHPPGTRTRYTPHCSACWEIRETSGRYSSHWNAFLFKHEFTM